MQFDPLRPALKLRLVAAWLALTVAAFFLDGAVRRSFNADFAQDFLRPVFAFPDYMGQYSIHLLVLALLFAVGTKWKTIREYLTLMIGSALICGTIKFAVGRARPGEDLGAFHFSPLTLANDGMHSFPSGEATSAMALATLLGIYFPRGRWIFFALGVWSSLGRVAMERHFLSDVIAGGGLGVICVLAGHAFFCRDRAASAKLEPAPPSEPIEETGAMGGPMPFDLP